MPIATASGLSMTYRAPVRREGLKAAATSLLRRQYRNVLALRSVSFSLERGEMVGFIGPNGAGKTTTLKILSGVLHPTSGEVSVLGFRPAARQRAFLRQIALIRGSQPIGGPVDITVMDTLRFQQLLYEVPEPHFRDNLDELNHLLQLGPLLQRQLRALSLGERMRVGLAGSLIYRPKVLFLDEPTLGLDVSAVVMVRDFFRRYREQTGATILLTSHYLADVETLCQRVILIDHGELRYEGPLEELSRRLSPYKVLRIGTTASSPPNWARFGEVIEADGQNVTLRVKRDQVPETTARLLADLPVADLSVENPPLENVIDQIYREGLSC